MNIKGLKKEIWLFLKAQLSAQTATVVDFSVSLLLAELFGLWYVGASFLGAVSGGICNTGGTYLFTEMSGRHFIFAKALVSIAVALLWNYQLQRLFVYKDQHLTHPTHHKKDNN